MSGTHEQLLLVKKAKLGTGAAAKEGTLSVYPNVLKWEPSAASGASAVTILPSSITGQQIAKGKPFLRLLTKISPFVFTFGGEDDVQTVRAALANITALGGAGTSSAPSHADAKKLRESATNAEAAKIRGEAKKKLLEQDEDLKQLYNTLVGSKTLSDAEFWHSRQQLLSSTLPSLTQRQGMSTAMVADVRPTPDGKMNTIQFKLNQETIMQIFAEKPHVHKAFLANVPDNMDEKEFWERYFRHQYAAESRRILLSAGKENLANKVDDDQAHMFVDTDDAELQREARIKVRRVDPTVNIAADQDDGFSEGFGAAHDPRREKAKNVGYAADIMRDINRHSEVVLTGLPASAKPAAGGSMVKAAAALAQARSQVAATSSTSGEAQGGSKRDGLVLEDLVEGEQAEYQELKIQDPRRYFERMGQDGTSGSAPSTSGQLDPHSCLQLLKSVNADNLSSLPFQLVDPRISMQVLLDLSKDGLTGDELDRHGRPTKAPQEVLQAGVTGVLRQMAMAINELLRHFWASFPPTTPAKSQKLQKLRDALNRQYDSVEKMRDMIPAADRMYANQLLKPVMSAMDCAFDKHRAFQQHSQRRGSTGAAQQAVKG